MSASNNGNNGVAVQVDVQPDRPRVPPANPMPSTEGGRGRLLGGGEP